MFRSIRWRLVTSYVVLTLITIGVMSLLAQWAVSRYAQEQEIASLTTNAESISQQVYPLMLDKIDTGELIQLARAASIFGNVRVRILDDDQRLIADSGLPDSSSELMWLVIPRESIGIRSNRQSQGWILGLTQHREAIPFDELFPFIETLPLDTPLTIVQRVEGPWGTRLFLGSMTRQGDLQPLPSRLDTDARPRSQNNVTYPVGNPRNPLGYVELSDGTDFSLEALQTTRQAFILAGIGAIVLAGILGLWMGNRISKPISNLSFTTRKMTTGDLSFRANVAGKDEIGQLATQFNSMAEQLQSNFDQMTSERDQLRRFISDASHELRTPITALRSFNELLLGPAAQDQQAREEFLQESHIQLERLSWITQNLLDLSRMDAGLVDLDLQPHLVNDLIETALSSYKTRFDDKHITLEISFPEAPLYVVCDRGRIELVISNLVDNALYFTPEGGRIGIGVDQVNGEIQIYVDDNGAGINPEDQPHIFDRFYRGSNSAPNGSGLGLSIVKSVVSAHNGTITVTSEPEEGTRFDIYLPLQHD